MLLNEGVEVYLAIAPTDMRKNIDTLAILVSEQFDLNPACGSVFVFLSKRCDRVKLLYFDRNGFVLYYKRLERGRFKLPAIDGKIGVIEPLQLRNLLAGLDIDKIRLPKRLQYHNFI